MQITHVEATPDVPKKEAERFAAVQKITEEIHTETVSLILARIPTHAVKMLSVKQMVTEQSAAAHEDGLVSHMPEEDASTILVMKILAEQTLTAKTRMEMQFVLAGQIMKATLTLAVN